MSRAGVASFPETSPAGSISPPHNESGAATPRGDGERREGWDGWIGEGEGDESAAGGARCGLNPPRLVRTYNNTVNFGSGLTGRFLIPAVPSPISGRDLIDSVSTSTRPFPPPPPIPSPRSEPPFARSVPQSQCCIYRTGYQFCEPRLTANNLRL